MISFKKLSLGLQKQKLLNSPHRMDVYGDYYQPLISIYLNFGGNMEAQALKMTKYFLSPVSS